MRKILIVISLAVAAASIPGMALAYHPGLNTTTGEAIPQYSVREEGGMSMAEYNPGLNTTTGMPITPSVTQTIGVSSGIAEYNPGLNTITGMPIAPQ